MQVWSWWWSAARVDERAQHDEAQAALLQQLMEAMPASSTSWRLGTPAPAAANSTTRAEVTKTGRSAPGIR